MKKIRICMIVVFAAFLALVSGGSILQKDRTFSPNENRYLAELPKLTAETLLDGSFQEDLEDYLRDQICFRDAWITVKTAIQKACLDTDIGGAYVGRDGYDFEKITPEDVDDALVERNIVAVQDYFETASQTLEKSRLSFLLVPSSGLVLSDKLPDNARLFDQTAYMDKIEAALDGYNVVDVRDTLQSHASDDIYYRTDHHWTSEGAYLAYELWCKSTGVSAPALDTLEKTVVTDSFRGSLYSKILDADSAYDSIWVYGTDGTVFGDSVTVTFEETEQADSCYVASQLAQKDKYKYFFGDNYGQVQIESDSGSGNLLVIKDSFANTFVPFAAGQYENIYMVDLRYYNGDMKEYLTAHDITDVLVLYNVTNFISDRNISKLTGGL